MYSVSYLEPVCCSMPSSNCRFLTCLQVSQEAGQVVWYSQLFQNFPEFITLWEISILIYTCVDWKHFYLRKPLTWLCSNCGFPGDSVVKNLPAMGKTWVQSLGQEVSPKKKMATHSSILAWEIPCTEEPGRLQSMGHKRARHDLMTKQWKQFK